MMMRNNLFAQMLGPSGSVSPSVSPSVSHGGGDRRVTDMAGVGEGYFLVQKDDGEKIFTENGQRLAGAALAQIVDAPPLKVAPLAEMGRVLVVNVIPRARFDPTLPLIIVPTSGAYITWYRRYWRGLQSWLANDPWSDHHLRRLERRLALAARQWVSDAEWSFFVDWLLHGRLGECRWGK